MMFNWARGFSRFFQKSKSPIRNAHRPRRGDFRPFVEMLEDRRVPTIFSVTVNTDNGGINPAVGAGTGTLRQAIIDSNAAGTGNIINFSIGTGLQTISITAGSPLPTITRAVTINGFSQPGFATTPVIQLQGPSGNDFDGLQLGAGSSGSLIEGLAIDGFGVAGIEIDTNGNQVQGNFIGTSPAGNTTSATLANFDGVLIFNTTGNTIGGTSSGVGNLISGNNVGVVIAADGNQVSSGNLVEGNFIGTDITGKVKLANTFEGVLIQGGDSPGPVSPTDGQANNNTIGGLDTVSGRTLGGQAGNLISGNGTQGVNIFQATASSKATGNLIEGNYIGTTAAGKGALGNLGDGVRIDTAAGNTVGGVVIGDGNLISGNGFGTNALNGVDILKTGASGNLVQGNTIGANVTGTADIDTGFADVFIGYGAANNTVGGTTSGAGNLLTSAFQAGVFVFGNNTTGTTGNLIQGNTVGLLSGGTVNSINPFGIELTNGAANNTVGGTAAGAGNLIGGNTLDGVEIDSAGTSGNLVQGNTVGTNAAGNTTTALQNGWAGVFLGYGATQNTVGGTAAGAGNLLSNNFETGLEIFQAGTTGNLVQGNTVGTNAAGTSIVGNGVNGIFLLDTTANTIGGTTAAAGNLISGNKVDGIDVISFSTGLLCSANLIEGNSIGTQAGGNAALAGLPASAWAGIFIGYGEANANTIGGTAAGAGNLISGNAVIGIELFQGATANLIQGNKIGTNAAVNAKLGNIHGILLLGGAAGNTIGGTVAGAGNVISGNTGDGILFQTGGSGTTSGNLVQGNIIGSNTITSGSGPNLGNGSNGVELQSGTGPNTVGGSVAGANRIVNSGGVAILDNGSGDNTSNNILT
jgi:titin